MFITSILNYFKKLFMKDYQQKSAKEVSSDYFLIDDMSVTSMLAERVSTLALADCEIKVDGESQVAQELNKIMHDFNETKLQTVSELCLGTGDVLVRPTTDGKEIGFDIIPNENFRVVSSVAGNLKSVIIKCAEQKLSTGITFERWELQQLLKDEDDVPYLEISQHAFKNGKPYPIKFTLWANMEAPTRIANCDQLLVARFKNIKTNRVNVNSDVGVPITFGAEKVVKRVVKSYNDLNAEFDKSQKWIFADRTLFRPIEKNINGHVYRKKILPKNSNIIQTNSTGNVGSAPLIQEFNPSIRINEYEQGLERNLRMLEMVCGFSEGLLTKSTITYSNTDEVRKSTQQTYAFITKYRQMLQNGLKILLDSLCLLYEINNNVDTSDVVLDCDWSDAYVESMTDRFSQLIQGETVGAIGKAELRSWLMNEPIEVSKQKVAEIVQDDEIKLDNDVNIVE